MVKPLRVVMVVWLANVCDVLGVWLAAVCRGVERGANLLLGRTIFIHC